MNKTRKKPHKQSAAKRLVQGSFILSCTRSLSSGVIAFFKKGFASPLLASVNKVDSFVRDKISNPIGEKIGIRKNFTNPVRNAIASFCTNNAFMKRMASLRTAFLQTSLRTVGVFFLTFGLYGIGAFFLKRYIDTAFGAGSPDDLAFAAILALVGMLFCVFGDRSIISALGTGRITGALLLEYLGVNPSVFNSYSSNPTGSTVGEGIILGMLCGIATLFFSPAVVLLFLVALLAILAVLHIPEFGLLLAASTFSFAPVGFTAAVIGVTLLSFLVKCIRLKRNFRFGTVDAVVLILLFSLFVRFAISGGEISQGEALLMCFVSVYFLAKNLLCSEKLVFQTFNALTVGLSVGMVLYILGEYCAYIPHQQLRDASAWASQYTLDSDMLCMAVAAVLPFALSTFSVHGSRRTDTRFLFLAIACAVITDSFLAYALALIAFFVFVATAAKAPVGTALGALITLPPALVAISHFASSSVVTAGALKQCDSVLDYARTFSNLFTGLVDYCGWWVTLLFVVSVLLVIQRVLGCSLVCFSRRISLFCSTLFASVVMLAVCSFMFNPLSDLRVFAVMWFTFGLCGAVYKVYTVRDNSDLEV